MFHNVSVRVWAFTDTNGGHRLESHPLEAGGSRDRPVRPGTTPQVSHRHQLDRLWVGTWVCVE